MSTEYVLIYWCNLFMCKLLNWFLIGGDSNRKIKCSCINASDVIPMAQSPSRGCNDNVALVGPADLCLAIFLYLCSVDMSRMYLYQQWEACYCKFLIMLAYSKLSQNMKYASSYRHMKYMQKLLFFFFNIFEEYYQAFKSHKSLLFFLRHLGTPSSRHLFPMSKKSYCNTICVFACLHLRPGVTRGRFI